MRTVTNHTAYYEIYKCPDICRATRRKTTVYIKQNSCCSNICCDNAGMRVAAGEARVTPCDDWSKESKLSLAMLYFPDQEYSQGFCPCEALSHGTMFPELVM